MDTKEVEQQKTKDDTKIEPNKDIEKNKNKEEPNASITYRRIAQVVGTDTNSTNPADQRPQSSRTARNNGAVAGRRGKRLPNDPAPWLGAVARGVGSSANRTCRGKA